MTLPRHTLPGMHLRHAAIPRDATSPQPRLYSVRQRNPPPCSERPPSHLPLPRYIVTSAYHPSLPTRSSPMAVAHNSLRTRRPGGSQFLPPPRTGGTWCSRSQLLAAISPHLPSPPACEYTSGPPSCSLYHSSRTQPLLCSLPLADLLPVGSHPTFRHRR